MKYFEAVILRFEVEIVARQLSLNLIPEERQAHHVAPMNRACLACVPGHSRATPIGCSIWSGLTISMSGEFSI